MLHFFFKLLELEAKFTRQNKQPNLFLERMCFLIFAFFVQLPRKLSVMDVQYVLQLSPQTAFRRRIAVSYCIVTSLCIYMLIYFYQLPEVLHISYCSNCRLVLTTHCCLHWFIPWCDIPVTQWPSGRNKIYWSGSRDWKWSRVPEKQKSTDEESDFQCNLPPSCIFFRDFRFLYLNVRSNERLYLKEN